MKNCKICSSFAFNLAQEGIDQGALCDRHYWQDRAEKAEKDAARYRWIRLGRADIEADGEFVLMTTLFDQFHTSSPSEFDSAIDAAIAKDAP